MLRKKLLARLGLLVVGFVTGAVVSILLLQTVLRDLDDIQARTSVASVPTSAQVAAAPPSSVALEQAALSRRLRTLIVGLTIAALVMTNIAIVVLVRTANMILRPVQELIDGSRALAAERFDRRISLSRGRKGTRADEFDELAHAYNALAEQLASNEQRKVKALQQLAVTLNHEINNVVNGIELQLRLLARRSGSDPALALQLGSIHANLERVAQTIASLRSVRRVVVTDYLPGESMLDLPRCIEPDGLPVPASLPAVQTQELSHG
jgi:signal transduction histidine kinase